MQAVSQLFDLRPVDTRPSDLPSTVFVIDGDRAVREALEQLDRAAGWVARSFDCRRELPPLC